MNAALQLAKEAQKSDEYEAALSDVQEALDKAIANGEEVAANTTATQEEIDDAWNLLFDAVQALQFQNGNMAGLQASWIWPIRCRRKTSRRLPGMQWSP